ncbi:glycine--tRNA ligase subunit beta [Brevundimonas subvibrioides]|uniref:Glycine--tRNA ligase beta subunit n=1 Tax=Brevundimonas subvibrioides (strain ATCC 15264 / DSM 4735 / LMG 14903 / NBRC 16000 / CB 81) TaxID=633149 RepID=D9QMS2_BRESC|nr:glycine--tRNA ligase subunit beta [Brevundimonas subvibrioides]ADL02078.1 glycyl-tRNA synthetase, beta subunit [Brevundimonas subvibrioides ATCC 15264]
MPQLLIELFSEEIPARMQGGAARDLERMATERLKAAGLSWDALTTWAGPRRLTLVIDGLPAATPDRSEELKGPRANAPEQALEGFLRKTGLTRDQLTERDGVLFAVIEEAGRPTTTVIAETLDQIVRAFPWPKSMRWGSGTLRWVRPLKRIVALFDEAVVPFAIDGIQSGDVTEGHRFMGAGQPFAVKDFADYRAKLDQHFVLLDAADRKLKILEAARAACHARGLELVDDDGLLDEVAGLAEWPTPILGDMDPQFLALPPEVVRLSMKVHQKYFAVRDPATGKLAPNFIVVANVEASDGGVALAAGNSRVLSARLNDARFFWDEDRKTGFDAWNEKLKGVTFHAKLGTLAGRVDRIAALAREIAPLVGADPDQAETAARLSKADLASAMVGEFPELQGIMGGYYARADHGDAIADAVRDHYKPQGPADSVPTAPLTVAVALADKLDTLVGFFAIDEKPTGSKDPFALRRAALGVIRLILDNGQRVALMPVFGSAFAELSTKAWGRPIARLADLEIAEEDGELTTAQTAELVQLRAADVQGRDPVGHTVEDDVANVDALLAFFADRLKVLLRDQGKRHDLVDAVFALGDDDLVRIVRRVEALDAFLATDDGANLLAGYKRASNILKAEAKKGEVPTGMVATGLANQPEAETTLAFATDVARTAVDTALETEDFAAAMTALSRLRAPVDAFFTDVMVNSDVPAERDNRLKLLGQVRDVMGRVADFGQVAG